MKESVEFIKGHLASNELGDGIKILPFEPIEIGSISVSRGPNFDVKLSQLSGSKVSEFSVEKLKIDTKNNVSDVLVYHPTINFEGKYELSVKLGLINVAGTGNCNGTISKQNFVYKT